MTAAASDPRQAAPRTPGITQAVVLAVVLAVLALALLNAPRDTPPTIAAISPHAVEAITEAPEEQQSSVGSATASGKGPAGDGGGGKGGPPRAAPAPVTTIGQEPGDNKTPRLRNCFEGRQIRDPQSPPCVPYFDGVNPGATAKGVSATTIKIIAPDGMNPAFINFVNSAFEFYGRHIVVVPFTPSNSCEPESQQAAARTAASLGIFASLSATGCTQHFFYTELARQKVVGVSFAEDYTEAEMTRAAPYLWQYPMAVDRQFAATGSWVCSRFAGRKAVHAGMNGTEDMRTLDRKFAVVLSRAHGSVKIDPAPIVQELKACGITPEVYSTQSAYGGGDESANTPGGAVVSDLKAKKVTTVICLCLYSGIGTVARTAEQQLYTPEWLTPDFQINGLNDTINGAYATWPASQRSHLMGITFRPRQLRAASDPTIWALSEGSGSDQSNSAAAGNTRYSLWLQYRSLLLIASGIQMAGPNLTPETFQQGLQRTRFPNPVTPINAGFVGFAGSHAMTIDAAEWWWSEDALPPFRGTSSPPNGSVCYVDHGRRNVPGQWRKGDDPFFAPACDSGGYPEDP